VPSVTCFFFFTGAPVVCGCRPTEDAKDRVLGFTGANSSILSADDFEVSIFLMETDTRHSLLHKHKHFRDKTQTKLTSNSSKLTGASRDAPIDVDDGGEQLYNADDVDDVPILLREESDDQDAIDLDDVPTIDETAANDASANRRPKRRRRGQPSGDGQGLESDNQSGNGNDDVGVEAIGDADSSDDQLFVGGGDSDSDGLGTSPPPPKRRKEKASAGEDDKKKKLAMDISYEGFAIYGRVLCLVVKRRDGGGSKGGIPSAVPPSSSKSQTGRPGGQAMMENWISSTQMPEAVAVDDDVA
jgi:hypothetical protein